MEVRINLDPEFEKVFNEYKKGYGEDIARLNGFSDKQLSYTDFIDNFIDKKVVADASIDSNANVAHKDIVSLENEMSKPHSKLLAFNKIYYELNKKYGEEVAKEWLKDEWVGNFYLHDAYNSSWVSYCFAYDIEELVDEGLFFIESFNAQPPQHLVTYTDFVCEFISWCCNRTSGAVGIPGFLVYSYYFLKKDVESGFVQKDADYYMRQEFQRFIYKLNQPFLRGGIQSA